ncbi:MAG: MarR family transcriptional regulator [Gemmatimonadales bacterium]
MRHNTPKATDADLATLAGFRYALRKFLRFSEQSATSAGLRPQHYLALLAIRGHPDNGRVTLGELAERLQVRPNSAVGLADRLARRGLLLRRRSARDAREVRLVLTARGERMLRKVASMNRAELTRLKDEIIRLLSTLGH